MKQAALAFQDLGCSVDEVNPGWGDPIAMEHCHFASNYAAMLGALCWTNGPTRWIPGLVALTRHGMTYTAADYCRAQGERLAYYDKVRAFFERYDLLADTQSVGRRVRRQAPHSVALGAASLGLAAMGRFQLSVQPDLAAGGDLSLRLHTGRVAGRSADRRGPLPRLACTASIAGVRAYPPVGAAATAALVQARATRQPRARSRSACWLGSS